MFEDIQKMNCAHNNIRVHDIICCLAPREKYKGEGVTAGLWREASLSDRVYHLVTGICRWSLRHAVVRGHHKRILSPYNHLINCTSSAKTVKCRRKRDVSVFVWEECHTGRNSSPVVEENTARFMSWNRLWVLTVQWLNRPQDRYWRQATSQAPKHVWDGW